MLLSVYFVMLVVVLQLLPVHVLLTTFEDGGVTIVGWYDGAENENPPPKPPP